MTFNACSRHAMAQRNVRRAKALAPEIFEKQIDTLIGEKTIDLVTKPIYIDTFFTAGTEAIINKDKVTTEVKIIPVEVKGETKYKWRVKTKVEKDTLYITYRDTLTITTREECTPVVVYRTPWTYWLFLGFLGAMDILMAWLLIKQNRKDGKEN